MTDKEILDWLEENVAYIMLGANYNVGRYQAETLDSGGSGWKDGKLREAVRRHIHNQKGDDAN